MAIAVEACRLRRRPLLMTASAFILGVAPPAVATVFGLVLTPVFEGVIRDVLGLSGRKTPAPPRAGPAAAPTAETAVTA